MKALRPSLRNQAIFVLGFNLLMVGIVSAVGSDLTLKIFLAINFSGLLIVMNWLPKSLVEMDERERLLLLKSQQKVLTVTHTLIAAVFAVHLTALPSMPVTDFMLFVGLPASLYMSWQSLRLRKEMT
jgi:hypothetical protein